MAFRLYPRSRPGKPSRPSKAAPLAVTTAEYRARIAVRALSGFKDGDDLVSIGFDPDSSKGGRLLSEHSPPKRGAD
jgi:hypothetical protein